MVQQAVRISQLPADTQPSSTAILPMVDGGVTSRVLAPALVPETDVRMYGTTGTSDDSATLVAALAATAVGGTVVVPGGVTLTIDNVTVTSRGIRGPGTLKWKAGSLNPMLHLAGTAPGLMDLTIDGESANHDAVERAVDTVAAAHPYIKNCRILNFRDTFLRTDIDLSTHGQISGCFIHNCGQIDDGNIIEIRGSKWSVMQCDFEHTTAQAHMIRTGQYSTASAFPVRDTRIIGCNFRDSDEAAIVCETYTQGIVISGNTFRGLGHGVKFENDVLELVFDVIVTDNEFRDLTSAFDSAFQFGVPGTYSGNRCYDCDSGFVFTRGAICIGNYLDNCGNTGLPCINVFSGSTGEYIISGNVIKNPPASCAGIDVAVGSCIITDNHIERAAGAAMTDGIVARGGNTTISGNVVKNVGGIGIRFFLDNNTVVGNTVDGATNGLYLETTCERSTVTGNALDNISSTKIRFTENAALRSCVIKDNAGADDIQFDLTIASGVITVGRSACKLSLETEAAGATDDLDTITATFPFVGQVLILRTNDSSHDVVVKHNTGNIFLAGAADFTMANTSHSIALLWSGTRWNELYRSTS